MNYKKKYEKLVNAVKVLRDNNPSDEGIQNWVNANVPELREESENEKIRKELVFYLGDMPEDTELRNGVTNRDVLDWLEKQGEQNPTDKVEPKFKVGDWIVQNGLGTYKIIEVCESWYEVISYNDGIQYSIGFDKEDDCHLWSIKDVKGGGVLQLGKVTAIFKEFIGKAHCKCYCSVYEREFEVPSKEGDDNSYGCYNATPATKEQRDLLFQKMKEAGYEWNAEKKELKKTGNRPMLSDFFNEVYERGKVDALKCVEWSEEDEEMLNSFLHKLEVCDLLSNKEIIWIKDKLKPLKERYAWKPSEEQMQVLTWCLPLFADPKLKEILKSLIDDLKKL